MKKVILILTVLLFPAIAFSAHKDGFTLNLKTSGSFVKELGGIATMPFDSEYSIYLKNTTERRCSARVFIDGARVSPMGDFVIGPNDELDLERFVTDLAEGKRFKFVPLSNPNIDDPTRAENGIVIVEFRFEKKPIWHPPEIEWGEFEDKLFYPEDFGSVTLDEATINVDTNCITSVSSTSAGATIGGSNSIQAFHKVDYDFEDEFVTLKLKIEGI